MVISHIAGKLSRCFLFAGILFGSIYNGNSSDQMTVVRRYFETNGPTTPEGLKTLLDREKPDVNSLFQILEERRFVGGLILLVNQALPSDQFLTANQAVILERILTSFQTNDNVQHLTMRLLLERQPVEQGVAFIERSIQRMSDRAVFEALRWLAVIAGKNEASELSKRAKLLVKQILIRLTESASAGRGDFIYTLTDNDLRRSVFREPEMATLWFHYLMTRLQRIETLYDSQQMMAVLSLFKLAKLPNFPSSTIQEALTAEIVREPGDRTKVWLWTLHRNNGLYATNLLAQSAVSNALVKLPDFADYARRLSKGEVGPNEGFWKPIAALRENAGKK